MKGLAVRSPSAAPTPPSPSAQSPLLAPEPAGSHWAGTGSVPRPQRQHGCLHLDLLEHRLYQSSACRAGPGCKQTFTEQGRSTNMTYRLPLAPTDECHLLPLPRCPSRAAAEEDQEELVVSLTCHTVPPSRPSSRQLPLRLLRGWVARAWPRGTRSHDRRLTSQGVSLSGSRSRGGCCSDSRQLKHR